MDKKQLQERLKRFAIAIVHFAESLPDTPGLRTVKNIRLFEVVLLQQLIIELLVELNQIKIISIKWE